MDDKPKRFKAFVKRLYREIEKANPDWRVSEYAIPMTFLLEKRTFDGISVNITFIRTRVALVMAGLKKIAPLVHKELSKELRTMK
ncbi:MAG: hypothetical protein PHF86_08640 [Candidatus Nanoarchaeia archaeon]|jgi:hypothetical protein|nr:hypothetical protein [Candidatus Nanoarchaeia archaeon]